MCYFRSEPSKTGGQVRIVKGQCLRLAALFMLGSAWPYPNACRRQCAGT